MSYPELFALVIGINTYHLPTNFNLTYARQDADRFKEFLISVGVPSPNIINLRDGEATRASILGAFQSLITNEAILKDDPIVIYYAGHGGRVPKPTAWVDWPTNGPQIEIMCPSDMGTVVDGEIIDGIPDRTIAAILQELSVAKGDNITFILDCCSSAGMSRSASSQANDGAVRQIFNPPSINADCDRDVWERSAQPRAGMRGIGTYEGFLGKHQGSHVLLAACGVNEFAWEKRGFGGIFTHQLLRILNDGNLGDLTYVSLMHRLQMPPNQTPHCEGRNIDRRLFNNRIPGANRSLLLGRRNDETGELVLEIGDAHGATVGSVYEIYETVLDPGPENPPLCTLVITRIEPLRSFVDFPDDEYDIPGLFYAKKLTNGPAKPFLVYCSDEGLIDKLFPDEQSRNNYGINFVSSSTSADFSVLVDDAKRMVNFERYNPLVVPHIGSRLSFSIRLTNYSALRKVIECAVNFDRHLKRSGEDVRNIWMELREAEFESGSGYATQPNLRSLGPNLLENDYAIAPISRPITLTIFNQTSLDLYPHVFYFDPSDLSITAWYTPAIGGHSGKSKPVDSPMLSKSYLTLGYGDTATSPWCFGLYPEKDVDVGFFKIFFTTSPSDFTSLLQSSPFQGALRAGQLDKPSSILADFWGTKLATVVHKKL